MVKRRTRRKPQPETPAQPLPAGSELNPQVTRRYLQCGVIVLLLLFGAYQSIIYYQHQPVPNSDFPAFSETTRPLLSFKLPGSFKRLPMLGLLHIAVGAVCPGPHPELTAGWIVNAVLHALTVLLLYRVGRHLLDEHAFYFAVLASINPWLLQLSYDPIAETAIVFFTLLTFDFLLRRSRWCYLFAMMASMVRYECTVLIPIAFCVDMVLSKPKKEKLVALLYAFGAGLPLILWLLGTALTWKAGSNSSSYLKHFTKEETRVGLKYWNLLWSTTFDPLLQVPSYVAAVFGKLKVTAQQQADSLQQVANTLGVLIRVVTGLGLVAGLVVAAIRKNWKFWALFGFWIAYVGAHSMKNVTLDRYTIPVMWLTLLIAWFGLQSISRWIANKAEANVPGFVRILALVIVLLVCLVWIAKLIPTLPATISMSHGSVSLVYVALSTVLIYLLVRWWLDQQNRDIFKSTVCLAACGLLLVSNQFQVVRVVGNGGKDAEFKELADWYIENAKSGERLITTMQPVVCLFVPEHKDNILHTGGGKAETFPEFINECYRRNITYAVWDSRLGLTPQDYYYKRWNLQRLAPLGQGKDVVGPFKLVKTIRQSKRRYLYIYELQPLSSFPPEIQRKLTGQTEKQS